MKCGDKFIPARCVLWAAGVKRSPIEESLGSELDRSGRVIVAEDLTIPGHSNVFVIGDQAAAKCAKTGKPIPGVARARCRVVTPATSAAVNSSQYRRGFWQR